MIQQTYLELLAGWGDHPLDEQSVKMVLQLLFEQGYADCRADMEMDLEAVIGMLIGGTKRQKIANYIREYLLEGEK